MEKRKEKKNQLITRKNEIWRDLYGPYTLFNSTESCPGQTEMRERSTVNETNFVYR
jgi:hypothetical protein